MWHSDQTTVKNIAIYNWADKFSMSMYTRYSYRKYPRLLKEINKIIESDHRTATIHLGKEHLVI